jgi:choline-sulfatase
MMAKTQPNIVFLFTDQHAAPFTGCYGDEAADTPNLDRLASDGALFENAHCPSPLCVPSRMSMMAGTYPHDLGVYTNRDYLKSDTPTFAHALGVAGYNTSLIGRMHFIGPDQLHGYQTRRVGDISVNWPGSPLINFGGLNKARGTKGPTLQYAGIGETTVHHYDRSVTKGALEYINELAENRNDQPFFMTVGWYGPHPPFIALEEDYKFFEGRIPPPSLSPPTENEHSYLRSWRDQGEFHQIPQDQIIRGRTAYYANLRMIDRQIGKVLNHLKNNNLLDNTLIVYASDHGEQLGERGFWQKNTFYDHSVKVPLIASWPGQIHTGQKRSEIVNLIDLSASFIAAGGATPLPHGKGQSFLGLLEDQPTEWQDFTLSEFYGGLVSIKTSAIANRMVRNERFKYVYYHGHEAQLFDMLEDSNETNDLIASPDYQDIVIQMNELALKNWNPSDIIEQIARKSKDVDILKHWTQTVNPIEDHRWVNG